MVHADGAVAERRKTRCDLEEGRRLRRAVRDCRTVDQRLVLLHPWNVRIGEAGDAIRSDIRDVAQRPVDGLRRLQRQAVHDVDREAGNALAAQEVCGGAHGLDRLLAVDCRHDPRVGVLDAEARPIEAERGVGPRFFDREAARVDLDRNLGGAVALKGSVDCLEHALHLVAAEDGRRAAAEVNRVQPLAAWQPRCHQRNLGDQRIDIGLDRAMAVGRLGVAAAEPAHLLAERHVEIEPDPLANGKA